MAGDPAGVEPEHHPHREHQLGARRQRVVAGDEEQREPVVEGVAGGAFGFHGRGVGLVARREVRQQPVEALLPAYVVEPRAPADPDAPRHEVVDLAGRTGSGAGERLGGVLLTEVEAARGDGERPHHLGPGGAKRRRVVRGRAVGHSKGCTLRISTRLPVGTFVASVLASSSSHSTA